MAGFRIVYKKSNWNKYIVGFVRLLSDIGYNAYHYKLLNRNIEGSGKGMSRKLVRLSNIVLIWPSAGVFEEIADWIDVDNDPGLSEIQTILPSHPIGPLQRLLQNLIGFQFC